MAAKKRKKRESVFNLIISFDNDQVRDMFRGWLSDGGGEQDFMAVAHSDGFTIDVDYDGDIVVVNSFTT